MALQRRLVVGLCTASSLLAVYLLCLNLQSVINVAPFRRLQELSSLGNQSRSISFLLSSLGADGSLALQDSERDGVYSTASTASTANTQDQSTAKNTAKPRPTTAAATKAPLTPKKPEPTVPDFFGDSYYSEDPPPLTDCPGAVRRLLPQTDFVDRFKPDIPVLQWIKHLNPDQFKRLQHYGGAHGWAYLTYEMLLDTLSVLNTSQTGTLLDDWPRRRNGSRCIRCAVVGNGGILKDSGRGSEIDQHHYVFRTNGAILKGFEKDVGSRTTHYTFSTNTLRNSMRSYGRLGYSRPPQSQETRYVFLPDHDRDYLLMKAAATHSHVDHGPEHNVDPTVWFGANLTAEKFKIYHPDFIRYLRNRFLRSGILNGRYKTIYRPSTGATMLLAALHTCDQVSAYGFMTPDYQKYSDHYFDQTYRKVGFFANHDLRMEMSLWQQLHKAGLINLYMRQDQDQNQNQI